MKTIVAMVLLGSTLAVASSGCAIKAEEDGAIVQTSEALLDGLLLASFDNGTWKFDNSGDGVYGSGDSTSSFGLPGDIPLAGWARGLVYNCNTASAAKEIGTYRPSTHQFFLDTNGDRVWSAGDTTIDFSVTPAGFTDTPVLFQAHNGSSGGVQNCLTVVGVFRTPNAGGQGFWYIDWNGNGVWDGTPTDLRAQFGDTGDIPVPQVVFQGSSRNLTSSLAVFRPTDGAWYIDRNLDNVMSNCTTDTCIPVGSFGMINDNQAFVNPSTATIAISRNGTQFIDSFRNGGWDSQDTQVTFATSSQKALLLER